MPEKNIEGYSIRKTAVFREDTHYGETGRPADGEPVTKILFMALVQNPYAGRYSEDLGLLVDNSEALGRYVGAQLRELVGDREVASYGKACVVGVAGEYEHGNALLTSAFADPVRDAIGGGIAWIPSTGKRGGPGVTIDIPLAHKDALYVRSHYDTLTFTIADGPAPDEIALLFAVATRGRLHARLGGLEVAEISARDGLR
jgi:hypothetical protein